MKWTHKELVRLAFEREKTLKHPTVEGLRLRVFPSGKKYWRWNRMLDGIPLRSHLGRFPAMKMAQAEAGARELNEQVDLGIDPTIKSEPVPEPTEQVRMTVSEAWDRYIADCARRKCRSIASRDQTGKKDLVSVVGDKFLADVTGDDVRYCADGPIRRGMGNTKGHTRSNTVLSTIKTFYRFCLRHRYDGLAFNPADAVDPIPKKRIVGRKKPRPLTVRELALVILAARELDRQNEAALQEWRERNPGRSYNRLAQPSTWSDNITLLVMTGCRKNEIFEAFSDEWDGERGVFIVDRHRYKTSVDCALPVGPTARAIFERRAKGGGYIIPSQNGIRTGRDGHICAKLRALMEDIGGGPVSHWSMHNIRHGFRNRIRQQKIADSELAERIIHPGQQDDIDEIYDTDWFAEMKEALASWDERVQAEIRSITALSAVA